ncbi:MAG TPA: PEP-CTERM sorting domain-containing protein [Cyanobacteria bacterium UBA11149]|nr:PEP-CTERM sorting domain-containing protein [Cyanobacteria bacterium UBA11367]HBE56957.1 PEP-CTERM sorting domain-containing protein [Cyanobacteria bacterium UBA11366]HBK65200.1 PEP-CTERM sorting domain-containing protein [Cyanobacteria bacterium UBA11166]HBR74688.1 PEP-CTERM sorting domain-containing protein [Cyanobacteria bacterium UBA11159]HBS71786.1 PEP-CTERM sorting domain-containing protein [Cyanobacteria bacterium UBA11153]HBW91208.1 PEP-CTERM sorting domain-containing protein [Cyano
MRKQTFATGFVLFYFILPLKTMAASFTSIYVFGDSLSDPGNVSQVTGGLIPQSLPYLNGRFSNGLNWVDYLGQDLGLNPVPVTKLTSILPKEGINFAFGGATTANTNTIPIPGLPGLNQEIETFKSLTSSPDAHSLYVVYAGANDYLGGGETNPANPVGNLSQTITSLFNMGARNFLVPNLPDLGNTPLGLSLGSAGSNGLNFLSAAHNVGLSNALDGLNKSLSGINIIPLDVNSLVKDAINGKLGFTNVTESCLTNFNFQSPPDFDYNICDTPDTYLFWDNLHPTTAANRLVADAALAAIADNQKSVPEPSEDWGIFALAALGVGGMLQHKLAKSH